MIYFRNSKNPNISLYYRCSLDLWFIINRNSAYNRSGYLYDFWKFFPFYGRHYLFHGIFGLSKENRSHFQWPHSRNLVADRVSTGTRAATSEKCIQCTFKRMQTVKCEPLFIDWLEGVSRKIKIALKRAVSKCISTMERVGYSLEFTCGLKYFFKNYFL